jgi:hypothetical protein
MALANRKVLKEEEAFKRFSNGKRTRKLFPAISVLNPFLLKLMR